MKNRNRQEAAKKRVRDNNGKFTGGLLLRKPQTIFTTQRHTDTHKVASNFNKARIHHDDEHQTSINVDKTSNIVQQQTNEL